LSVVNVLKGIYYGDCIIKKGLGILGGTKIRRQKVLQGAKPGVYIERMEQNAGAVDM